MAEAGLRTGLDPDRARMVQDLVTAGFEVDPAAPDVAGPEAAAGAASPLFNAETIAAALVDRAGRVVAASPAFAAMGGERHVDPELAARAAAGAAPATAAVDLAGEGGGEPDTVIFAYAPAGQAAAWRLPPPVAETALRHPGHAVILTSRASGAQRPLEAACHAYGLTGLQTRVALETIRTGSVIAAAGRLGISYHTAREALAEAMRRAQAPRLPALVNRLTSLAFGVLPQDDATGVLADLWGLSPRQAAIAGLVADGLSRGQAAAALGISAAVVKKELDRVYQVLQVGAAAGLARKIVEAQALRGLTAATGRDIGFLEAGGEPLQFAPRPHGGRIAISDYGPASGRPVLMAHSSMTTRTVARGLVRALQAAGYRPIAVDRPGFGLTDEAPGAKAGAHDPFATAAEDALAVLDHLRLKRVDLAARGAAQFVLALARRAPERLGRVVLVNPDPHSAASRGGVGPYDVMKHAFMRSPALIRFSVGVIARLLTSQSVAASMQRASRGSPPDEAATADPQIALDYFRAQRLFATGRIAGAVNEQTALARGARPEPLTGTANWRVLVGGHDTLHDPDEVLAYWREVLPHARFEVKPDAGRLLAWSHPHHVVAALREP